MRVISVARAVEYWMSISPRIWTSVMLRGICSFGHRRIIRTDESLTLSEDPAVAITAVDSPTVIRAITDEALAMAASGLYTVERASLLELGVRFLADYLRGDSYFLLGPADPVDLNKIRAMAQVTLFERLREAAPEMKREIAALRARGTGAEGRA